MLHFSSFIPYPCLADTHSTVDVRILEIFHPQELTITTLSDTLHIHLKDNKMVIDQKRNAIFFSALPSTVTVPGKIERSYQGTIKVYPLLDELVIINRIAIDAYLASIVGAEMGDAPFEAQKAQAIVSRTYLFRNLKRHEQYDFCDLTHCQVYKGMETETERARRAVLETNGMLLYQNGTIAELFYHSTCGGRTADYSSIFEGDNEALVSISDSNYCSASPHYEWEWFLPVDEAPFQELFVSRRGQDERVTEILVDGTPERGWQFRMRIAQQFGWNRLRSSWFSVEKKDDHFLFKGHGLGHGLGMCQWGARKLAEEGASAEEILHHYFPKLQLRIEL
jgi:stage II sporulation protein D